MKKEFWMCIIGNTTRENLPDGADSQIRNAVRNKFKELTGHEDEYCWSGWGLTEKRKELLLRLWCMPEENLPEKIEMVKTK